MKILLGLTSHDQLGNTGHKTGFWLEEFAAARSSQRRSVSADGSHASFRGSFVLVDGKLVTGQNPASSVGVANAVIGMLGTPG